MWLYITHYTTTNDSHESKVYANPKYSFLENESESCQHNVNLTLSSHSCSCFSEAPIFWEKVDPTSPYQVTLTGIINKIKLINKTIQYSKLYPRNYMVLSAI